MSNNPENKNLFEKQKDFEARQNLFGFFSLLLEVDRRVNPHLYKKQKNKKEKKDDR